MKKLAYFIVIMAIITAVDHPVINNFYDNTIGQFKMFAREGIKTAKNPGAGRVFRTMEKHFATYTKAEIELIDSLTKNNQDDLAFRKTFCVDGEFNPVIYGAHLKQFCSVIEDNKTQLNIIVK